MARNNRIPKLRRHSSGQGFVELSGHRLYCGPFDDERTRRKADRLIAEWLANGRRLSRPPEQITVAEVLVRYLDFAEVWYRRKDGSVTSEVNSYKSALRSVNRLFGDLPAAEFGARSLKTVRGAFIERGLCRRTVNAYTKRVRRVFSWAAQEELIPADKLPAMAAVSTLPIGRTEAKESRGVQCAPMEHVEAALPELRADARAMVLLQLLTGARPGEVVNMRREEIDTRGRPWVYRPAQHKLAHLDRVRQVPIGPQARDVLAPFLLRTKQGKLFGFYDVKGYRAHIHRACRRAYKRLHPRASKAEIRKHTPTFNPGQLRHNAATAARTLLGLDAAQALLGHASADTTQVYAEVSHGKAAEVVERIG